MKEELMTKSATIFDEKGNKTYEVDSNGNERWYDYDGKLTHYRNSKGEEKWYNSIGQVIYEKYPNGLEYRYERDSRCNPICVPEWTL